MKKIILSIIIILTLLTTGCWDMVEINQRLFPYSIGIDLNPGEGDKYIITITYPNIYGIGSNATQENRINTVSTVSKSIFLGSRQLSTRLQYPFYFKHLKVIVLGHELSKNEKEVREIVDGLNRDFVINKKVRLVTAEGMARDVLLSVPKAEREEVIEGTLYSLLRDDKRTSRYTPQTLTDFIRDMDMTGISTMPRASFHGEDIKIFGACIFDNYRFIGHINEIQNTSVSLMKGSVKEEIVEAPFDDTSFTYSISNASVKRELVRDGENLKIRLNIETEGVLREFIQREDKIIETVDFIHDLEKAVEKRLQGKIKDTLNIIQKEYKADVIGIGEYLHKFHPNIWKEVSDDWNEIFSEIDIETNIKVYIRRIGLVQ